GKIIEVERSPLVAAVAKKVKKEKELRSTFEQASTNKLTDEEFVSGTISPLWLGMRDSNPRSWDQNPLPYHLANPQRLARRNIFEIFNRIRLTFGEPATFMLA